MTRAAKDVASAPPSTDLLLPDAFGLSCVFGLVLAEVGDDTGSRRVRIGPGVLNLLLL